MLALLLKANPNHDARGRFTFAAEGGGGPSAPAIPQRSADITTEAEAEGYWRARFGNKRLRLLSHTSEGDVPVAVFCDAENDHPYTEDESEIAGGMKTGNRVFSQKRAKLLDKIAAVVRRPHFRLDDGGTHLYIGHFDPDVIYLLALRKNPNRGCYDLASAYPISRHELAGKRRALRPVLPIQEMKKAEAPMRSAHGASGSAFLIFGPRPGVSRRPSERTTRVSASAAAEISDVIALCKALPPGARWITVRPNGAGSEGHPVLIQPSGDGAYRVIGGAGGKLNYLKLTGVKSEADYAASAKRKVAAHREEQKRRRDRDRAMGLQGMKAKARDAVRDAVAEHETKFVQTVAEAMKWSQNDMRFPEEKYQNASAEAQRRAARAHGKALLARAREAVDLQRKRLLQDAEARGAAGLGEVRLTTTAPDEITVQDLAPVAQAGTGLGFQADYQGRAERAGTTRDDVREEAERVRAAGDDPARAAANAVSRRTERIMSERIGAELAEIRDAGPVVKPHAPVEPRKAVDLLKAEKALRQARQAARTRNQESQPAREYGATVRAEAHHDRFSSGASPRNTTAPTPTARCGSAAPRSPTTVAALGGRRRPR